MSGKRTVFRILCSDPSASVMASVAGESCARKVSAGNESTAEAAIKQSEAPVSTRHLSNTPFITKCRKRGDDFVRVTSDPSIAESSALSSRFR